MSGDILTVKTVKRVRSVRGSALVHTTYLVHTTTYLTAMQISITTLRSSSKFGWGNQ